MLKEGLSEGWGKKAEALDTAQYMYGLSSLSNGADVKLSKALNELYALKANPATHRPLAKESQTLLPGETTSRALTEIARMNGLIANTRILVERLPELKSMEGEAERLTKALEEGQQEVDFLSSRDENEVIAAIQSGEHKPWVYTPKQKELHYGKRPAPDQRRALEICLETDDWMFDALARDTQDFNQACSTKRKSCGRATRPRRPGPGGSRPFSTP